MDGKLNATRLLELALYVVDGDGTIRADPEAAAQVRRLNGGYLSHPTVIVVGMVRVEPKIRELDVALDRVGLSAWPAAASREDGR